MSILNDKEVEKLHDTLQGLVSVCVIHMQELSFASSVFIQQDTTDDNITERLLEVIPTIADLELPVLSKEDTSNVFAISPKALRLNNVFLIKQANAGRSELRTQCITTIALLRALKELQVEAIRMLFLNRFDVRREVNKSKFSRHVHQSMYIATQALEHSRIYTVTASRLVDDLAMLYH